MKKSIPIFAVALLFIIMQACSPKLAKHTVLDFTDKADVNFNYFANGHLSEEKYTFKTAEKDGRMAGEFLRASDAQTFAGMYSFPAEPINLNNGKQFTIDVWMDHLGTFTIKLEESLDGGQNTSISVKNTKINQWETLTFDFKNDILGFYTYPKITIFSDIFTPATGKDVRSYFSTIQQISSGEKIKIKGNKDEAINIVILGSSTAAGTGPTESRNAWVNRYRRKVQALNGHHQVINLAVGGYTTYHLLPSEVKVPEDRPQPSVEHNTTKALSLQPDAVIINLPSNDAARGYSIREQLDNYTLICQPFYDRGIPVWVSTPQGRNMEEEKRAEQRILLDSTYIRFGRKTLDFWKGLAHWSGTINPKYNSGDGVHLNDEAHLLLLDEVWNKDILTAVKNKRASVIGTDLSYTTPLKREGYVLNWQDEFGGNELNANNWSHELGDGCPELCGWGNREKVWYRPENSQVKEGKLIIDVKADKEQEGYWSASRIITNKKVEFHFGRLDIRAKLPETKGLWPAIWLLGSNRAEEGWPYCGEIDIMEEVGHIPHQILGTIHYKGLDGIVNSKGDKYELKYNNFSDEFHVFSIDWDEEGIRFFVDDQIYANRKYVDLNIDEKDNPFMKPFYMIINCAVGGNLPGNPNKTSVFPQTLEIDYVRYFKKK